MLQNLSADAPGASLQPRAPLPATARARQLRERVEESIRREPVRAILIAGVSGLVVGRLIRMVMRRLDSANAHARVD